jgi:phosphoglycolate phosphatase
VFNLVVFDLDGTLVDTAAEIVLALNAALAERGLPATDESAVRGWLGHGARELLRRARRGSRSRPS